MFAPLFYFSLKSEFYILIHLKPILHIWIYINSAYKLTFWNKDTWNIRSKVKVKGLVAQLCPTLCYPVDHSPPGSSVHAALQSRILEWVAIPFSRESSWPRDQTKVSPLQGDYLLSESPGKPMLFSSQVVPNSSQPHGLQYFLHKKYHVLHCYVVF